MNVTYTICQKKRSKLLGNSGKIFFLENPTYIQGEQETFIMYCNPWRPNVSPLQSWGCGGGGRGGTMILSHLVNKIWDMRLLQKNLHPILSLSTFLPTPITSPLPPLLSQILWQWDHKPIATSTTTKTWKLLQDIYSCMHIILSCTFDIFSVPCRKRHWRKK